MTAPHDLPTLKAYLDQALADQPCVRFHNARMAVIEKVLAALSDAGLSIVKGFDTSTAPHDAVRDAVPLVLYFASRADADEMVAAVQQWKVCPAKAANTIGAWTRSPKIADRSCSVLSTCAPGAATIRRTM